MCGYLPHINRLFVVFTHCTRSCSRNTMVSQLHATDAIVPLARDFGSWTWRHWSLQRCQCDESSALCEVATSPIEGPTFLFSITSPTFLLKILLHILSIHCHICCIAPRSLHQRSPFWPSSCYTVSCVVQGLNILLRASADNFPRCASSTVGGALRLDAGPHVGPPMSQ
jgi:hypothetical protein